MKTKRTDEEQVLGGLSPRQVLRLAIVQKVDGIAPQDLVQKAWEPTTSKRTRVSACLRGWKFAFDARSNDIGLQELVDVMWKSTFSGVEKPPEGRLSLANTMVDKAFKRHCVRLHEAPKTAASPVE